MNITQVKIFPVEEEKLKAFVSIVFDHCFMVNDIKVIQGKDGLFLSMPSRRKKSGEFKDVAHPLNNETRRDIEETVLREYRAMVDDATPRRPDRENDLAEPAPLAQYASSNGSSRSGSKEGLTEDAVMHAESRTPSASSLVAKAQTNGGGEVAEGESRLDSRQSTEETDPSLEEVQERHLRDSFWTVS
ncbi:MAG: septation regulator SpoVG [Thermoanaerobaculia bacterium]|nr:septation regulator SpoVG [Thermoanaerobaculia bacterium]